MMFLMTFDNIRVIRKVFFVGATRQTLPFSRSNERFSSLQQHKKTTSLEINYETALGNDIFSSCSERATGVDNLCEF